MKTGAMTLFEWKKTGMSGKWAFPLIVLLIFLGMSYTMAPAGILDSFAQSAYVLFLLMMAFGMITDTVDSGMIDAAIMVKCGKNHHKLYLSKVLSIGIYNVIGAFIAMFAPVLRYWSDGTDFFLREMLVTDVMTGMSLHLLMGMSGGIFGLLLNERIMKRRPVAIGTGVLIAIVSLLKNIIIKDFSWTVFFLWILPPVAELEEKYGCVEWVNLLQIPYFVWMLFYVIVQVIIYIVSMQKLKIR